MEYHRAQVRKFLGFRECTVADAGKLTEWLAGEVCQRERRPERVREELLRRCGAEGIEQPAPGRMHRIIGSGLRQAEKILVATVSGRIPEQVTAAMTALVAEAAGDEDEEMPCGDDRALLARIKDDPGNVSLNTAREEVAKLAAIRAIGLPSAVFAGIAPKVIAGWRDRAAVEFPSHLRDHSEEVKVTLLAALLYCRGREITDTLVDLLIATVHKINAHAERRVVGEFVADLKRVSGKENILFKITEAAVGDPDGVVREVVFPAAGGEGTLLDLLAEYKTKGSTFRQHKQRVFKASYTHHYRAGLIELIDALEFRSHNTVHRPVLEALQLIKRYRVNTTHATQYYARGELVPDRRGDRRRPGRAAAPRR